MLIWLGKQRLDQKDGDHDLKEAPNQPEIDKDHIIMSQAHKILELEANVNQPKTE